MKIEIVIFVLLLKFKVRIKMESKRYWNESKILVWMNIIVIDKIIKDIGIEIVGEKMFKYCFKSFMYMFLFIEV